MLLICPPNFFHTVFCTQLSIKLCPHIFSIQLFHPILPPNLFTIGQPFFSTKLLKTISQSTFPPVCPVSSWAFLEIYSYVYFLSYATLASYVVFLNFHYSGEIFSADITFFKVQLLQQQKIQVCQKYLSVET